MNCRLAPSLRILLPGLALLLPAVAAVPLLRAPAAPAGQRLPAAAADLPAGKYVIDPVHSNVVFRILHMGVSPFWGRFNHVEGHFSVDPEKPEDATLEVTIQADSVDTNNDKRNQHAMSPDFLNVKEFPLIEFRSEAVRKVKDNLFEVDGKLTLHGVTKDVTAQVEQIGAAEARGAMLAGFEATFTILRTEFGMDQLLDGLSDEVRVTVGIEAGLES